MWINIVSLSHQASYFMTYKNNAFDVRHDYFEYAYVRKYLTILAMSHLSHLPILLCNLFDVHLTFINHSCFIMHSRQTLNLFTCVHCYICLFIFSFCSTSETHDSHGIYWLLNKNSNPIMVFLSLICFVF